MIKSIRKIKLKGQYISGDAKIFCFKTLTSKYSMEEDPDDFPEKDIKLIFPKIIMVEESEESDLSFYLNRSFPHRSNGVAFSYNREFYNCLCMGDWYEICEGESFREDDNKMGLLLYSYLSTFNSSGYWLASRNPDICKLCKGHSNEERFCSYCLYRIKEKTPTGMKTYYPHSKTKISDIRYDNKTSYFIYKKKKAKVKDDT